MGIGNNIILMFLFLIGLIFLQSQSCYAAYNITRFNPLSENQTLSSPQGIFELGFFRPNGSQNQYLGIWYKTGVPQVIVWVANREKPLLGSAANLTISRNGSLILVDGKLDVFWSSGANYSSGNSYAELSDNGDFVLKDGNSGDVLWESFKHPRNILLPNSTLTYNLKTGEKRVLTSWKTNTDPSPGEYVAVILPREPVQAFVMKGSMPYWRSGPWSKTKFIGIEGMDVSYVRAHRVSGDSEQGIVNYSFDPSVISTYMVISPEGSLKVMSKEENSWRAVWESTDNLCDAYGTCGPYGVCIRDERPRCECLRGYVPRSVQEWMNGNWTGGCIRRTELLCERVSSSASNKNEKPDVFFKMSMIKIPDRYQYVRFKDSDKCIVDCKQNCSCVAYAFVDGIGCLIWEEQLLDTVQFSSDGEELFLRLAHSELGGQKLPDVLIVSLIVVSMLTILSVVSCVLYKRRAAKGRHKKTLQKYVCSIDLKPADASDVYFFDFRTILVATDNFSMSNKLGQGGFGPVYKGKLPDGKEIAVKRLASSSGQGTEEFKNEILLISKLQHRNLVKLLGCCLEKEEKLLVYEFMVNKSLDTFLFDPLKNVELDWVKRFNIIQGIARGMLYLHRDSCLRVVHRDLKGGNILLDETMNPKISDFGLARMFQGTQDLTNTRRVVGTLGYMSPEYALAGVFSEKSDVFSFGVLMLEIVSGLKTNSFSYDDESLTLLAHAWKLWSESRELKLLDQALTDLYSSTEATRCVHIALLCVQDSAADRPNMFEVVSMLNSATELPQPKQPTLTFQDIRPRDSQLKPDDNFSVNEITESAIQGR